MKIAIINGVRMQATVEGCIPILTKKQIAERIEDNNRANQRYLDSERDKSFLRNMHFSH